MTALVLSRKRRMFLRARVIADLRALSVIDYNRIADLVISLARAERQRRAGGAR